MDRKLLRERAKKEYKKMMADIPKKRRPTFQQVFPTIKATLLKSGVNSAIEKKAADIEDSDADLLENMLAGFSLGDSEDGDTQDQ